MATQPLTIIREYLPNIGRQLRALHLLLGSEPRPQPSLTNTALHTRSTNVRAPYAVTPATVPARTSAPARTHSIQRRRARKRGWA